MKALVYHGPGARAWEEASDPEIDALTDIVMRVDAVTICGTDLHTLKGDAEVAGDDPRPRGRRHGRRDRRRGDDVARGRLRARVLHHVPRPMRVVPWRGATGSAPAARRSSAI